MPANKVRHLKPTSRKSSDEAAAEDRARFEMYQAFMIGYVRRINEASFNVTIGGVRIGSAKYSRLAQINLQSRIITFSRFAVENVPERGRRYLVLHELAHVKEASHNKNFWGHVERYEPDYKKVSRELEVAFKNNVRDEHQRLKKMSFSNSLGRSAKDSQSSTVTKLLNYKLDYGKPSSGESGSNYKGLIIDPREAQEENFDCMEEEFALWDVEEADGIVNGGSDFDSETQYEGDSPSNSRLERAFGSDYVQLKLPF